MLLSVQPASTVIVIVWQSDSAVAAVVDVGCGEGVGVGCGILSTSPSLMVQLASKLFSLMILCTETPNSAAIEEQ